MTTSKAAYALALLAPLCLTGCTAIGDKTASLSIIYAATAVLSLVMLVCYLKLARSKDRWFVLLFSSVLVVNLGYWLLSISTSLDQALMANRLAYLGSVILPPAMLMIIMNVTNTPRRPWVPGVLLGIAAVTFAVAASPGILEIYYKEVSFTVVNGCGTLVKTYGPLHPLYLLYLIGYFGAMVIVILRASATNRTASTSHAFVLAIAVLVNIGVWLIEQIVAIEFEFLSVSYIASELFLLGAHLMASENNEPQSTLLNQNKICQPELESIPEPSEMSKKLIGTPAVNNEVLEMFVSGIGNLTKTERVIFDAYLDRATTKEIMASLGITENTLKFHNKNLYRKLGVRSRKELMELSKHVSVPGRDA
ncbi:MAG: hypothetical protein IJO87_03525 [Eggerthellaceae bacterium]|nr:hypothetical protein [Eggerthellaceae bacterium]